MLKVAASDVQGLWTGLAPMHFHFKSQQGSKFVRLRPDMHPEKIVSGVRVIRAFPKAFLCPIGWVVAVSTQIEGSFLLNDLPALANHLRSEQVFLHKGSLASLKDVMSSMNRIISSVLLAQDSSLGNTEDQEIYPYSVSSPVAFQGQPMFNPMAAELDLPSVFGVIGEGMAPQANGRIVTPGPHTIALTVFNRGTMLITNGSGSGPECALSNMKNLLLMTVLMQKYHVSAYGNKGAAVMKMRDEVAQTFRVLKAKWEAPHFQQICAAHQGIIKMLRAGDIQRPSPIPYDVLNDRLNMTLSYVFGVVFLAAILALVVFIPKPSDAQWKVFCVVLSLAAGGIATTISGMLKVDLNLGKRAVIGGTGALAVFLIVYFFVPAMAK